MSCTYHPSKARRKRKLGYMARMMSRAGRDVILRRIRKGRARLAA
ncbi:50S ribosomal protein L34 [Candidatus Tremblaya princeps]|uniref:Large ribosomal subunit protein bL34 n=1 Tax=Tremblaya princeps TaxID=189385 RepID=A0A143WNN7_TREPR|nr:50S ribosomal protein L34 [Candidatus Tremblaya princeps]